MLVHICSKLYSQVKSTGAFVGLGEGEVRLDRRLEVLVTGNQEEGRRDGFE